jgi:hypothetical protein
VPIGTAAEGAIETAASDGREAVAMFTANVGVAAVVAMADKVGTVREGASATGSEDGAGGVSGS